MDPYRRYQPGQAIPRDAATFSAFAEGARIARDSGAGMSAGTSGQFRQGDIIKVKNESGLDLTRRSILALSMPVFTPTDSEDAFLRDVVMRGATPSTTDAGKFAILLEPAAQDQVVRAYVAGVVQVQVDVSDDTHTCAEVGTSTSALDSATSGSAQILWREGGTGVQWAIVRFGSTCGGDSGGSTTTPSRCACPEATYEVEADCGLCGGFYGSGQTMPKYWWVVIESSTETSYAYSDACTAIECVQLQGLRIRVDNETGAYGAATCTWSGRGASCVHAELTVDGSNWKITVSDSDDCVLAVLRKSIQSFNCCGQNTGWTNDPSNSCELQVTLDPDPCTCCPDPTCPPDNLPVCTGTDCCLQSCNCSINITVSNLFSPSGLPCTFVDTDCVDLDGNPCSFGDPNCYKTLPNPTSICGGMNGTYAMTWASNCTWTFRGVPGGIGSTDVAARLTLDGREWVFTLYGAEGQVAVFRTVGWECDDFVYMPMLGGTCAGFGSSATFTLCLFVGG